MATVTILALVVAVAVVIAHYVQPLVSPPSGSSEPVISDTSVLKSTQDDREYVVVTLTNSLRVLLISDKETNISSAAMDVAVGSFSDGKHEGLAHFCEHMLFYGSKKYPEEGAYSDFLSQHGGYDNAYTSTQNTNYFFRVTSDYLSEALDRFAQFFISPILVQDGVSREVNAVDAEHRKNLESDGWRLWQLLKHISNPDHPFHNFNTGNLETLNTPDIVKALNVYYESYYSANQMQLVIYGRETTDQLMEFAVDMFSPIKNKDISQPTFTTTSFPAPYNGRITYYVPVANTNIMTIYWQVEPLIEKYREQVSNIFSYLFGHEGHGSILQYLKQQQWATALFAGVEVDTDSYSLLSVQITLTEEGLSCASDVIAVVTQYTKLCQSLSSNQWTLLWQDYIASNNITFEYAPRVDPDSYASDLASTMRYTSSPADFLSSPSRYQFNEDLLTHTLSSLSPSTAIIFLGSKQFEHPQDVIQSGHTPLTIPPSLSKTEPIYGTVYEDVDISDSLISYWESAAGAELAMPVSNGFIPRDLDVLPLPENISTVPQKVDTEEDGVSIWWLRDSQFKEPKVDIYCDLSVPQTQDSLNDPQWTALNQLYVSVVTNILKPVLYPATLVGYNPVIESTSRGVSIQISGFSDISIMNKIIMLTVNALHNETLLSDAATFSLSLQGLVQQITNFNFTALPYRYVYQYIQSVTMERPSWHGWQLLEVLRNVTVDTFLQHVHQVLDGPSLLNCLVHGNVHSSQAISYSSAISAIAVLSSVDPSGQFFKRRLSLAPGNYSVIVPALNPADKNSVINVLFQLGRECEKDSSTQKCLQSSLKTAVLAGLMTLQMKQSCFDVLRTQLQLGYVAYCLHRTNQDIGSFQVLVQSGTRSASYILDRIDEFLINYRSTFVDFFSSSSNLTDLKAIYRQVLLQKPLSMSVTSIKYYSQIATGLNQFDYNQQQLSYMNDVTSSDLIDFYDTNLLGVGTSRKLVIAVYGNGTQTTLDAPIQNHIDFTNLSPKQKEYP